MYNTPSVPPPSSIYPNPYPLQASCTTPSVPPPSSAQTTPSTTLMVAVKNEKVQFEKLVEEEVVRVLERMTTSGYGQGDSEDPGDDNDEASTPKIVHFARFVTDWTSEKLEHSFGWKVAFYIATAILLLDIIFVTIYTLIISNWCTAQIQLIDSEMWKSSELFKNIAKSDFTSFGRERWYLCSSQQMSFRSQLFSLDHLQKLDNLSLPEDQICHLNGQRSSHATLQVNSSSAETAPDFIVHDMTWIDFYPCMFKGLSCNDYGNRNQCGDELVYPIIKGCEDGLVEGWNSPKTSRPNGTWHDSYDCASNDIVHGDPKNNLTDQYRHFGACNGLISVTVNVCPNTSLALGAAFGWVSAVNLVFLALILPFAFYFKKDHQGSKTKSILEILSAAAPTERTERPSESVSNRATIMLARNDKPTQAAPSDMVHPNPEDEHLA